MLLSDSPAPSEWVLKWIAMMPHAGLVLDLAAGSGRHTKLLAKSGYTVEAVDRDISRLIEFSGNHSVHVCECDIEDGSWSCPGSYYSGIVVTNYLFRPVLPFLVDALTPGGVLIYETFATGNEIYGRPSNPDFLLREGELLEVVRGRLKVLGFEHVYTSKPKPAMVQRICAIRSES